MASVAIMRSMARMAETADAMSETMASTETARMAPVLSPSGYQACMLEWMTATGARPPTKPISADSVEAKFPIRTPLPCDRQLAHRRDDRPCSGDDAVLR